MAVAWPNEASLSSRENPKKRAFQEGSNEPRLFRQIEGYSDVQSFESSGLHGGHRADVATQHVLDGPEIPLIRSQEERVKTALRKEVPLGKLVLRMDDDVKET